ncbi:hypothetical protein McpAg1_02940 [Methanocorpusculaceae archaeon Ag1]|uniref:Uncharacterized protein n=1 Tax=Methanorbis furvi TaxID=3028299 RepID=A0AAE4MA78_9EURY|nr:hypothetical protein [Methanocorpusculaceae archaeon Ag1]
MKDQNHGYCQRAAVSRGVTKYNTTYQHINPGPRVLKVPPLIFRDKHESPKMTTSKNRMAARKERRASLNPS